MKLTKGETVTVQTLSGKEVTGEVFSILDNTVIVLCGIDKYVVKKQQLKQQGYSFSKIKRPAFSVVH
ncbi:hypothetical protein [Enterococcus wangshanyuanii]|uniref:Uncharacterized protein n=1 Tax=Enterococcus wangshanyuanii TaxID=2005703 RepID=A0ABQ1PV84_9ENTE|nr:hypothetical protein [Enterococcus wangshanyuanii]GGD04503.1 hypothetical protein GCM10011573_37520 [Enterococcus wangshanyuanii]